MSSGKVPDGLPKGHVSDLTDSELDQFVADITLDIAMGEAHLARARTEQRRRKREAKYGPQYDGDGNRLVRPRTH